MKLQHWAIIALLYWSISKKRIMIQMLIKQLAPALPGLLKQIEPKILEALSSKHQKTLTENPDLPIKQSGFFVCEKDGKLMAFECGVDENGQLLKPRNHKDYDLKELLENLLKNAQ